MLLAPGCLMDEEGIDITNMSDDDFFDAVIEYMEDSEDRYFDYVVEGDIDSPSG